MNRYVVETLFLKQCFVTTMFVNEWIVDNIIKK